MKTVKHKLCLECQKMVQDAGLDYRRLGIGDKPVCDFCGKRRATEVYEIRYGRKGETK